jgi:hypothetical protein
VHLPAPGARLAAAALVEHGLEAVEVVLDPPVVEAERAADLLLEALGLQPISTVTSVLPASAGRNVTWPALVLPSIERQAMRSSGTCSVISASRSCRLPPKAVTRCGCRSSSCSTRSTPFMKRGNSSNCVHWL